MSPTRETDTLLDSETTPEKLKLTFSHKQINWGFALKISEFWILELFIFSEDKLTDIFFVDPWRRQNGWVSSEEYFYSYRREWGGGKSMKKVAWDQAEGVGVWFKLHVHI